MSATVVAIGPFVDRSIHDGVGSRPIKPVRRLQSDVAAEGRGDPDRAAAVGAGGDRGEARDDRGAAAAARAARRPRRRPRVARRAEQAVVGEPSRANSGRFVFPTTIAPARGGCAITSWSRAAGGASRMEQRGERRREPGDVFVVLHEERQPRERSRTRHRPPIERIDGRAHRRARGLASPHEDRRVERRVRRSIRSSGACTSSSGETSRRRTDAASASSTYMSSPSSPIDAITQSRCDPISKSNNSSSRSSKDSKPASRRSP